MLGAAGGSDLFPAAPLRVSVIFTFAGRAAVRAPSGEHRSIS